MPIDALIKRFFPGIILGLIALAAYFQASGLVQLVASGLVSSEDESLAKWQAAPASPTGPALARKDSEPILSRNPFDHETGPLNAQPMDLEGMSAPAQKIDLSNPLAAPACGGVSVRIVTESPDPTWSIAVFTAPGDATPRMRRVGDEAGDKKVAFIGYNPVKGSPAVWLANESSLCQALLFAGPDVPQPQAAAAPPPAPEEVKPRAAGGAAAVPQEIADRIHKVSDTEFNVDRGVVDKILEDQAQLMRSARIVPEQQNGKVVGIRLFGVRPETLLGKLGLQNGDRLEQINGFDMASPEKALEAYARLRTADQLSVKVTRRGKPMTIDFHIK